MKSVSGKAETANANSPPQHSNALKPMPEAVMQAIIRRRGIIQKFSTIFPVEEYEKIVQTDLFEDS